MKLEASIHDGAAVNSLVRHEMHELPCGMNCRFRGMNCGCAA